MDTIRETFFCSFGQIGVRIMTTELPSHIHKLRVGTRRLKYYSLVIQFSKTNEERLKKSAQPLHL